MRGRRRGTAADLCSLGISHTPWFIFAVFALINCWAVCFFVVTYSWKHGEVVSRGKQLRVQDGGGRMSIDSPSNVVDKKSHAVKLKPINLSRTGKVVATADVRGNLGPASVVVQPHPGKDWIHDRWQAASDMHGTAIKGVHWILLDFGEEVVADEIILDWEAAYSERYRLEASLIPITAETTMDQVWIVFDALDPLHKAQIRIEKKGKSPGVKTETPLHVIHKFRAQTSKPFRYLRLYILGSAMGWGVSLWQFDVIGYKKEEVIE